MNVYVMVTARVKPGTGAEFERAFETVSEAVRGTDGHVGDRLLYDAGTDRYVLVGVWESEERFRAWEDAPVHRETTVPLRPFWDGPVERTIYRVAVDGSA